MVVEFLNIFIIFEYFRPFKKIYFYTPNLKLRVKHNALYYWL